MVKRKDFAANNDIATGMAVSGVDPAVIQGTALQTTENNEGMSYGTAVGVQEAQEARSLTSLSVALQNASSAVAKLDDVPESVRAQLTGYDDMIADERLLAVLGSYQQFTLDKIILALWHRFQHTEDRQKVIARLRLLCKRGLVDKVQGCRSVYVLRMPELLRVHADQSAFEAGERMRERETMAAKDSSANSGRTLPGHHDQGPE